MKGIQNTSTNNFSAIIGNNRKFVVPKFQRDYSWGNEQWDDLWQDIETMIADKEDHYMGYLVLQTNNDKDFQIIDGQQRFSTVTILILAALKCIKKLMLAGIDEEDNRKRLDNLMQVYIGKIDPVTLVYDNVLVLNRNNNSYFCDYIVKMDNLRVRSLKSSEKLMKQCFEFYEQKLQDKYPDGKGYAKFIQTVVDNLYFTQIVVSDEMNAFRVFETLNARGVQLSSSDLLKNYLFSLVDKAKAHPSRIEILEDKWTRLTDIIKEEKLSEFLRYYWNMSHKSIRANALFKTIRKEITTDTQVFRLVDDMIRCSDVYMALSEPNDELWEDKEVSYCVGLLNLLKLKQPYSVLMSAYLNLPPAQFKSLFKTIIKICFRRNTICDKNPNDQEGPFNSLAIMISEEKKVDLKRLLPVVVDDAVFENSFADKSFEYNSRNAKIVRYILGKLEKHDGLSLDITYDNENASIEHILPQNADENWNMDEDKVKQFAGRLGNVCLLEKKLNMEVKNLPYSEKSAVYKNSSFLDAKTLSDQYPSWDQNSIVARQRKMARKAVGIWNLRELK